MFFKNPHLITHVFKCPYSITQLHFLHLVHHSVHIDREIGIICQIGLKLQGYFCHITFSLFSKLPHTLSFCLHLPPHPTPPPANQSKTPPLHYHRLKPSSRLQLSTTTATIVESLQLLPHPNHHLRYKVIGKGTPSPLATATTHKYSFSASSNPVV